MTGESVNRPAAEKAIRSQVRARKVALTNHAKTRNPSAGKYPLTGEQIRNCLLNGSITEGPFRDIKEEGGWRVTVTRFKEDEKHEVAAVLIVEKRVLVITGYGWEKRVPRARPVARLEEIEEDDDE